MAHRLRFGRSAPAGTDRPEVPEPDGQDQAERILSALEDLRDMPVREVMTPRVDVVGLPIPVDASDLARAVRQSGHSTYPVYDDDLDNLVGVLYVHDLFRAGWELDGGAVADGTGRAVTPEAATGGAAPRAAGSAAAGAAAAGGAPVPGEAAARGAVAPPAGPRTGGEADEPLAAPSPVDISRRIRKPYLVPESRFVLDVLADMRHDRRAFAVVVDEYGGVAGIVTVKDLLGALVGDLRDEFDRGSEPDFIRVDRSRWLVDGGVSVDDLREHLGVPVPDGEYVTLGGYLFDVSGHIPEEGEVIRAGGWEYRVVEMDRRRVAKVVVRADDEGGAEAE